MGYTKVRVMYLKHTSTFDDPNDRIEAHGNINGNARATKFDAFIFTLTIPHIKKTSGNYMISNDEKDRVAVTYIRLQRPH